MIDLSTLLLLKGKEALVTGITSRDAKARLSFLSGAPPFADSWLSSRKHTNQQAQA
jgi:hypothetical protein